MKIRKARKVFERDSTHGAPAFLPADHVSVLMDRGYQPPDAVRYDPAGLVERADQKLRQITSVVDLTAIRTSLELGCWDGMVVAALATRGMTAVGLDMTSQGLDHRARDAGARFVQSDAEAIALGSESIDLVYSFASFEHFPHPDRCMNEVHRVLRPGGQAYLHFGPLYFSPYGLHAYRQIPVPFCHLLFREEDLHRWAAEHHLPHEWPFVNGWTLKRYRALWRSLESQFVVTDYREYTTGGVGVELVNRYPRCFTDRVDDFDELLVAFVDITLRKR
jgi:SAM-dependent methyltransferase